MVEIDGSAGGGQLLRTAVSLAAVTGEAVRITDVRGAREEPGLRPQHLAAVRTAGRLCDAEIEGDEIGSRALVFRPGPVRGGEHEVDIGTAGSVTLLADTLLPLATALDGPCRITATGGTDVKWSPSIGYVRLVKLPLLARFGLGASVAVERTGFYPAGGGRIVLRLDPSSLDRIDLPARGDRERVEIYSKASTHLEEAEVADRQADAAGRVLAAAGVPAETAAVDYVEALCPGSSILLRAVYEDVLAGFDALGERGKPSEDVGEEAAAAFLDFDAGPGAVDPHLADQVMVFLALAGGSVRIPRVTEHVRSNRTVVTAFGFDLQIDADGDGPILRADGTRWGRPRSGR